MGVPLFGVDISGAVKRAMAAGLPSIRLLKRSVSALDPDAPTATPSVSFRRFPCRGFEDTSKETRDQGTQVQQTGRLVLIIGDTLPRGTVPEPGDRIEILGETLEIVGDGVSNDPARATYLCATRG